MIRNESRNVNSPEELRSRRTMPGDASPLTHQSPIDFLKNEPTTEARLTSAPDLLQTLTQNNPQINNLSFGGQPVLSPDQTTASNQFAASVPVSADAVTQQKAASTDPVLREGSSGPKVVELQKLLESKGFSPGIADGDFGPNTKRAVVAFQESADLVPDGVVGENTWAALRSSPGAVTNPTPIEASRENVSNKRQAYEEAQEHAREPDLSLAYNRYEQALEDHLDALDTRGVSLENALSAAQEHEREPDLSNAKALVAENNQEKIDTRRTLTALRNNTEVPATAQDIDASRERVDSARTAFEQAQEHEREPDLTTARRNYANALDDHIDVLRSKTPALESAVSAAQEHGRQPDLRNAEQRLADHELEIRDTQITLSVVKDGHPLAPENGPLEIGDRGPAVAQLQDQLRELGYEPGISDGWFGSNTLTALRSFQEDQVSALESRLSITDHPAAGNRIEQQIQALNAENRGAVAGPITQQLLENPITDPLKADTSEFGDEFRNEYPDAAELLATGNFDKHFFRGVDLDLSQAERNTDAFNGGDNHVVVQSIFDPVVADKPTTIDEYSVHIHIPPGVDPQSVLLQLATDMDQFLGGEFKQLGDFKNQGNSPIVGQVIDIDVQDGILGVESPFNAPVIISSIEDDRFSVQTIEYNNSEHLLHGTREWGFEEQPDGSVKFFTHGISVEDTFAAEQGAKDGEMKFWSAWVDGIENYAVTNGGSVVDGTRVINQTQGPSGNQFWETLSPTQQNEIRASQISGHQREANWLQNQFDTQITEVSDIRDVRELDGINRVFDAIEGGDTQEVLRTMRSVIRNNEDSTDSDVIDALELFEELYTDVRSTNRLANEHRSEAEGWATR